jgi:hypothetical protein
MLDKCCDAESLERIAELDYIGIYCQNDGIWIRPSNGGIHFPNIMSALKPGTLCVIITGCPENIGLVVEVVQRLGVFQDYEDAYVIRTTSGRKFHQVWSGNDLIRGYSEECITGRHKLRPLVDPKDDAELDDVELAHNDGVAV